MQTPKALRNADKAQYRIDGGSSQEPYQEEPKFNLNWSWLRNISECITIFRNAWFMEDYHNCYKALDFMYMLLHPVIVKKKPKSIKKWEERMGWLENNLNSYILTDYKGEKNRVNLEKKMLLRKRLRFCFMRLEGFMDIHGILKFIEQDLIENFGMM